MAITISGENNNDRILAQDGVIDQISGINIVGVITSTSFTGDLTGNVTGNLTGNVNSTSPLLLQTGGSERFRITGNNELGIAGANYGSSGQVLTSGGSGSAVTWSAIPAQATIANNANNRVITGGSGVNLNGEANLVFDGSSLGIGEATPSQRLQVGGNSGDACLSLMRTNAASDNNAWGHVFFENSSDATLAAISARRESAADDAYLAFYTQSSGGSNDERLRITSTGKINIGDTQTSQNILNIEDGTAASMEFASHGTGGDTAYIGVKKSSGGGLTFGITNRDIIFKTGASYSSGTTFDSGTERLRIESSGVTTFSATNINVNRNAGDSFIALQTSGASNVSLYGGASSGFRVFTKPSGGSLTERLRITPDGKVGMGLVDAGGTGCDPDGNHLLIRGASTFQTAKGHIMLTGDSATVGQGPQIVFSESGSGSNNAGAYIGHVRQGSNSIGDLVFGTRGVSGDANTVPDERLRITSGGKIGVNVSSFTSGSNKESIMQIKAPTGYAALGIGATTKGIHIGWDGDRSAYDDMRVYRVDYSNAGTYGIAANLPCLVLSPTSAPGSGIVQETVWLKSTGRGSGNAEMNLMVDGDVCIGGDGQVPGVSQSGYPESIVGGRGNSKLTIQPDDRTTAFAASDGDTWHDVVLKQSGSATNNAVGIAFETSTSAYHKNAGTGIAAVKNGTNSDYGSDLVFITRPQSAVAAERVRISSEGYVTKPNQPSCMAYNPNGQFIAGGAIAVFNSTRFNIGSHYSTSNGRFTAPVAGRYLVAYSGLHDYQGQASAGFTIRLNGSDFDGGEAYDDIYGSTDAHQCQLAKTLILDMSANDYVQIYVRSSGTRIHQRYGSFSVCLLT